MATQGSEGLGKLQGGDETTRLRAVERVGRTTMWENCGRECSKRPLAEGLLPAVLIERTMVGGQFWLKEAGLDKLCGVAGNVSAIAFPGTARAGEVLPLQPRWPRPAASKCASPKGGSSSQ